MMKPLHSNTLIYYRSPEQFSFGDVLEIHGPYCIIDTIPSQVEFYEDGSFEKIGVCEELECTVTENETKVFNFFKDISDWFYHRHVSEDYYNEYTDFTLTEGETVTFYAYDGIPVLPKSDSSWSETALSKGDINGDETMDWCRNWIYSYSDDPFTVTTDDFYYSTSFYGITLENDLIDADYMINGIVLNDDGDVDYYVLTTINMDLGGERCITHFSPEELENYHGEIIQVGDLLNYPDDSLTAELFSPVMSATGRIEYLGHGTDIFGEEFQKVIRHEWIGNVSDADEETLGVDIIKGDVTEDEKVDILDVITLNKSILGKTTICNYAQYVADVDGNGTIDSVDSLNMLKYAVSLIESFDQ